MPIQLRDYQEDAVNRMKNGCILAGGVGSGQSYDTTTIISKTNNPNPYYHREEDNSKMEQNSLTHWGIPGMKWGRRRYQNKDGTLTPAGVARYNRDANEKGYDKEGAAGRRYKLVGEGAKQRVEGLNADANRYVKEDRERSRTLTNEAAGLTRNLKTMVDKSIKNTPKVKMDLSNMTEQEMRAQINRAMLEKQYNDIFAPQKSTKGREYVSDILDTAGNVLAVAGSAIGIALSIQALRGKA